jgi:putative sugar O-methyltransferase
MRQGRVTAPDQSWTYNHLKNYLKFSKKLFFGKEFKFHKVDLENFELSELQDVSIYSQRTREFAATFPDLAQLGGWSEVVVADTNSSNERMTSQILDDLIGVRGMSRPKVDEVIPYIRFFQSSNYCNWNISKLFKGFEKGNLKLTDLGSVCDVSILSELITPQDKTHVMEIGGGYGRLAEAFIHNHESRVEWNLVDVIPSSLAFAANFLRKSDVGLSQETLQKSQSHVRILHVNELERIADSSISVFVNLESFQEMTQEWVDFWIDQINLKSAPGAYFYHSNSFDYKNKFAMNLGSCWTKIHEINHPRHWTDSHRTEIFRRD